MTGFSESTLRIIELPELAPHLPFFFDDCSLAFYLRIRNKTLWWIIKNTNKHYTVSKIPKKKGTRLIHKPSIALKAILRRALVRVLEPLQEQLGDHVTAYRPGRSVRDAVLQHIPPCPICDGMPWGTSALKHECPREGTCVQLDLRDFFPTHRRAWIRHYFKSLGYGHDVSGYLAALFTVTNIPNPKAHKPGKRDLSYKKYFSGVPQGAPTSGAICNLVADHRLDRHMLPRLKHWNEVHGLEGTSQWVYTRYADDMTFSCGRKLDEQERHDFTKDIVTLIRRAGYEINKTKTRHSQNGKRRSLLGMTFNHRPNYRADKYDSLRSLTRNCMRNGFETQFERAGFASAEELIDWLRGTLLWVNQINPKKGARLLQMFQTATEFELVPPVSGLTEVE